MDRNTLLKSSSTKFLSIFDDLIKSAVHCSIETLYQKADRSLNSQVQRQMLDARTFVKHHEQELVNQIISQLKLLLDRSFKTAYDQFRPSFFNAAKAGSIELIDVHAFEDDLRIEVITSRFRNEAGEQLRDLNIRIAILFERNDIAERENPFRPYLLTRAIVLGVEATKVESGLLPIIVDQFAEELAPKVVTLYEGVNTHLFECGVAAQLQFKPQQMPSDLMHARKASMPDASKPDSGNRSRADSSVANLSKNVEQLLNLVKTRQQPQTDNNAINYPEINSELFTENERKNPHLHSPSMSTKSNLAKNNANGWLDGAYEIGDVLRKIFLGGTQRTNNKSANAQHDMESWQPGEAHFSSISPQLSHALQAQLPGANEIIERDGEVRNLLIERRNNLNSLTSNQHEKMTIDVVAMLFEFILKDHQVPAEVRAQLGRLQFSVLKMALMDSALLTTKSHPVRLLVNRIGSISVSLQQIDPTGKEISAEICRIVEELLMSDTESPELFTKMLDELDVFIAQELLASNALVENAVNVVVNAEQRMQRFEQASAKLEKMMSGFTIPSFLQRFLLDTWPHVIERVERNPNVESTRFRLLVPNIVWSVLPKASYDDRFMLLQIIPVLIPILREGMSLVAWLPEQQQELLNWLVDAHTSVMRTAVSATNTEPTSTLSDVQNHFRDFVYTTKEVLPTQKIAHNPEVTRTFLDEAIKELETELHSTGVLVDLDISPDLFGQHDNSAENEDAESGSDFFHRPSSETDGSDESSTITADSEVLSESDMDELNKEADKEVDILDRLWSGVMIEINLSGIPTLGRLNWISPNSSNLILTVNGQKTPSVISVRMFRRMLKNSHARFVEVAPLFERAVQSLLESADRVDLAH